MLFSNTAIRRYTPPTCTLKVAGKTSPLSRWGSRSLFEDLKFELRFDDPRKFEDDRVVLQGDRAQLELLCETVSTYTHDLLRHSSADRLSPALSLPAALLDPTPPEVPPATSEPQTLPGLLPETEPEKKLLRPDPHLTAKGLLAHQLFLGNLATEESGSSIQLSALQLFDLATALEEYSADIAALPEFKSSQPRQPFVAWGSAAAGVLLAAGLTAAVFQALNPSSTDELTASVEEQKVAADKHAPLAALPSPPVDTPIPSPVVPPAISSAPNLPPPPAVSGPLPSDRISPPIVVQPRNSRPSSTAVAPPSPPPRQQSQPLPREPQVPVQRAPAPAPTSSTNSPVASASPATPNLPNLPAPGAQEFERSTASVPESVAPPSNISEALQNNRKVAARDRAVENIPQVAEVQRYFQQRWQPPESLTETLEYSLPLNRDGTIQRIIPQGEVAGRYLDRTPMPLPRTNFGISPLSLEGTPKIRLSLHPDGQVGAYLESVE